MPRLAERGGGALGIVCDVGLTSSPTLRDRLEGFEFLAWFEAWSFSDETGWFKPAAEAFRPALEGLGVTDPSRAAHVGDNPRTDVAGARALGMTVDQLHGVPRCSAAEGSRPITSPTTTRGSPRSSASLEPSFHVERLRSLFLR